MGSTLKELVVDLESKPAHVHRDLMIKRAKAGYYHDFLTPAATPKMMLVQDMSMLGFDDIAAKVRSGEYDDEAPCDTLLSYP